MKPGATIDAATLAAALVVIIIFIVAFGGRKKLYNRYLLAIGI